MSTRFLDQYPAPSTGKFNAGGIITGTAFATIAACIIAILLLTEISKTGKAIMIGVMVLFGLISLFSFVITFANTTLSDVVSDLDYCMLKFDCFCDRNRIAIIAGSIAVAVPAILGILWSLYMLSSQPRTSAHIAFPVLIASLFGTIPILSLSKD